MVTSVATPRAMRRSVSHRRPGGREEDAVTKAERRSSIARYWPVALVVAIAAASITAGSLRGADHATTARPPAGDGVAPALAAFAGVDPLSAPDCDRSTGRLRIPVVSAPNCVPLWQKGRDNGGATSTGVTARE